MLNSVPEASRSDLRFRQVVTLANHLAAIRANWLDFIDGKGERQVVWWEAEDEVDTLQPCFFAVELTWIDCLARLDDG